MNPNPIYSTPYLKEQKHFSPLIQKTESIQFFPMEYVPILYLKHTNSFRTFPRHAYSSKVKSRAINAYKKTLEDATFGIFLGVPHSNIPLILLGTDKLYNSQYFCTIKSIRNYSSKKVFLTLYF